MKIGRMGNMKRQSTRGSREKVRRKWRKGRRAPEVN